MLFIALLFLAFLWGRNTAPMPEMQVEQVRVDTLLVCDTITQEKPVYRTKWVRDTIIVFVHDTIPVYLPREVKVYEDSLYRVEISGYKPSLDLIEIYQQKQVITKENTIFVTPRNRWSIGLQAGYGAHLHGSQVCLSPYIGIGFAYSLISR